MKHLLSIGEFAAISGIEKTTLRYWDQIGLLSPIERGPENNCRYYSYTQVLAVNFIRMLSKLQVPLSDIGALADQRSPESVLQLLDKQNLHLSLEMRKLYENRTIIRERCELIRYGMRMADGGLENGGISEWDMAERTLILGPPNEYHSEEAPYMALVRFRRYLEELRVNLHYPIGGYYETAESFFASPGKPDRFFTLDPTGNRKKPAGVYLRGFAKGCYSDYGDLPQRMKTYANEHGLPLSGPVYSFYLHDEVCVKDPSEYLLQITIAIAKRCHEGSHESGKARK